MNPGIAKQREPCSRSPNNKVKDVRPHVLYAVAIAPIGRSSSSSCSSSSIVVVVVVVVVISLEALGNQA
jgi:hypothetical protein